MGDFGIDSPASSVVLDPVESLSFHLQSQTSPQAVLTIRNVSESRKIAFKVKTTRPLRYLVRPNQGMLGPNATASIMVILQQKDCDELLRLDPSERQLSNDKFLVQSIFVDDSFYELVKTKSAKEMADELTSMWANTDKRSLANKKLRCRFVQDEDGSSSVHATARVAEPVERNPSNPTLLTSRVSAMSTSIDDLTSSRDRVTDLDVSTHEQLTSALLDEPSHRPTAASDYTPPGSGNNSSFQEVAALRKKYDELVAFTVQLTAQRDALMSDLDKTRQQLQKASTDVQRAKKDEGNASTLRQRKTGTSGSDDAHSPADKSVAVKEPAAFGLFHLLVCAIIFFLIGRFY